MQFNVFETTLVCCVDTIIGVVSLRKQGWDEMDYALHVKL